MQANQLTGLYMMETLVIGYHWSTYYYRFSFFFFLHGREGSVGARMLLSRESFALKEIILVHELTIFSTNS